MRVLLFLGLSVALLYSMVFADHHEGEGKKSGDKDDHENKGDHHHHHHGHRHHGHRHHGRHHGRHHHGHHHRHHHRGNETLACHKLAISNSNFAFDLYRQVAADHPSENIVLSPVSISVALAFLSLGANGETHDQILKGIGFNTSETPKKDIHDGFHHLLEVFNDEDSEFQLDSGNGLFLSQKWKFLDAFLENAKNIYESEAFNVDFSNSEEAKKQINSYVEKETNGKIVDVLSSVDTDAAFVLVNFIYFRGQWENPFDGQFTQEGDFHVNKDKTVKVPFLSRTGYYKVASSDDATIVALPYKGNASALFILPNEGKLEEVEANWKGLVKKFKRSNSEDLVDLSIPKFDISGSFDLKELLPKFGIVDVFSDSADLSGITGAPDLKVSKAVHKAKINVDEKGTEAAGATVLEAVPMRLPLQITLNRPFLLSIYNHETRSILFMAKVVDPAK
ncbi:alpha-1-antiproteinase F-like isoform X1 [Rana temporaria]|uniref:alpha-1-antiproteinase F-like isoform X1 n=1 Tax=Rana temporaria TaxID=8407 RepID=UPI001AAC7B24|nr:alpha-1-antiproteinase F-like isoform X1 [Rana temporaria]